MNAEELSTQEIPLQQNQPVTCIKPYEHSTVVLKGMVRSPKTKDGRLPTHNSWKKGSCSPLKQAAKAFKGFSSDLLWSLLLKLPFCKMKLYAAGEV